LSMNGEAANLTLREVARILRRRRTSDVPLRRPGEAEGIGWFRIDGEVLVPAAELQDWQRRVTVKWGARPSRSQLSASRRKEVRRARSDAPYQDLRSCERKPGHDAPRAARVT
jgi:hypothetical protein